MNALRPAIANVLLLTAGVVAPHPADGGTAPVMRGVSPSGAVFEVPRDSVDAGGGTLQGGAFAAVVVHAQPDAHARHVGGAFEATGGLLLLRESEPADVLFSSGFEAAPIPP